MRQTTVEITTKWDALSDWWFGGIPSVAPHPFVSGGTAEPVSPVCERNWRTEERSQLKDESSRQNIRWRKE
jgi:hypothetical protein